MEIIMEEPIKELKIMDSVIDPTLKKKPKIEVTGSKVWYGDFQAIKGIDMIIKANSVTAFIGPSGCGKSTFLRLFNRMNDLIISIALEWKVRSKSMTKIFIRKK